MSLHVLIFLIFLAGLITLLILGFAQQRKPFKKPGPRISDLSFETAQELIAPENTARIFAPVLELPVSYQDVRLTLLVRDPEWLYAYWEIASDRWDTIRHAYGNQITHDNICIRLVDLQDPLFHLDIPVKSLVGDWHIHVGKPNTPFYGILGLLTACGFIPITVSNAVTTPRNDISTIGDEDWMMVSDYELLIIKKMGALPFDATSPSFYDF